MLEQLLDSAKVFLLFVVKNANIAVSAVPVEANVVEVFGKQFWLVQVLRNIEIFDHV